ncbi:cell division cycle-associated 7-like protein [Senna tora]|uniref:Cell division cycle-associated 7-like protein n=1 Tax=Senna tora TaxID=362788 RepID=A0A834WMU1_9FABA|nr:cell division cycle-associated 7-like protein [Senna tora]
MQNVTPVSYTEVLPTGSKPEIYTEEHDKLLGNTEKSWTLFVDGYGKDGKRIYDSIRGKTCHQCRKLWVIVPSVANATWSRGSFVEIACT